MARLSKKELRLLVAFLATIFVAGNVLVLKGYLSSLKTARARIAAVSSQRESVDLLLSDRDYWEERERWLEEHQPQLDDAGASLGSLIETLQKGARENGITILEQTIVEPSGKSRYHQASVRLKLTAPMEEMIGWLAGIQAPERFYVISQFALSVDTRSKEEEPPAICTVQVGRLYRQKESGRRIP